MLALTNILNPLTGGSTTEEYQWVKGQPLSKYVGYEGECLVTWNGQMLDKPITDIMPADGEAYTWMAIPEGLKKEEWKLLGNIGLATAMFFLPVVAPLKAGLYLIGSALLSMLDEDKKQDESMSQSYAWDHTNSPSAARGMAMPIIYGKTRVRPILKNRYIKINNDKQELYALYSLAGHRVDETEDTDWVDLAFDDNHPIQPGQIVSSSDYPGMSFKFRSTAVYWAARGNIGDYRTAKPVIYFPDGKLNSDDWSVYHGTGAFHEDIYINGRAITDFHDDVKWETKPGLADQIDIEGFDVTYTNYAQDLALYSSRPILDRAAANIQYISSGTRRLVWDAHTVLYEGEIYNINEGNTPLSLGSNDTNYVFFAPNEPKGDKNYFSSIAPPAGTFIMFYNNRSVNGGDPEYYGDEATGLNWQTLSVDFTNIQNIELMFEFPYGLYGAPVGKSVATASCALFAQYRTRSTYSDEWGSWSNFDFDTIEEFPKTETYSDNIKAGIIQRKNRNPFNISLSAVISDDLLDSTLQYQIRTAISSSLLVTLVNVAGIVYGEEDENGNRAGFSYPGEPLIGIKALASGQISGDLDVQVDVERSKVWVYNILTESWEQNDANNHAWAVYDVLANGHPDHPTYPTLGNENAESIYGCGFSATQIDYESFKAWADYTNGQLGYELNIVFDTFTMAWDAILRICMEGRGMIYPQGSKIYAYVDKPTSTSQLFTMGNIHLETFVQSYADEQQKANMVEITYMDRERHYERTQIAMRASDWDSGTEPNNPTNLTLYGTTDYDQAVSVAQYMLLANELLSNSLLFSVDVDALAVEAGDVIEMQHDVLGSYGGRIQTFVENLLNNSGFEEGTYTADWAPWRVGGNPDIDIIATAFTHFGSSYSSHIRAWDSNIGRSQTMDCTPSTEYTFSAYVFLEDLNYNDSGTFRIMSHDGTDYHQQLVDTTVRESWQRISITMTTGASQTSMIVYLGGIGAGYWDDIQVEANDTAHIYVGDNTGVQLDKTITLTSGTYTLKIMDSNGVIDSHPKGASAGPHSPWYTFGDDVVWSNSPAKYDVYALSLASNPAQKYRITDISRSTELRRTIMAIQYDARVYEGYVPSSDAPIGENPWAAKTVAPSPTTVQSIANALNTASNVRLREVLSTNRVTGEIQSSIVVAWDPEQGHVRGGWEVWYRDVDEADVDWEGTHVEGTTYAFGKKVEHEGITYISLEDNNISIPISR